MAASCFGDETYNRSYTLAADFEYSNSTSFFRADSLYIDVQSGYGIGYQDFAFYHKLNADKTDVTGGFVASYLSSVRAETESGNTYRAYVVPASKYLNTYLVYRSGSPMPEHDMEFMNAKYGTCEMIACYVTNTVAVADAVAANFELGDRLSLKATGYLDGNKTGETEIALADFSAQKDSIVSTWTVFDLSKLGSVEYVDFEVVSTKDAVPGDFCLDYVVGSVNLSY